MVALQLPKASHFILRIVVAFDDVKSRRSHDFLAGRLIRVDSPPGSWSVFSGRREKPRPDCTPVKQAVKKLNAAVHAGRLARQVGKVPSHDDMSEAAIQSFAKIQRQTFSSCCLLLAAYRRPRFDSLNAVSRAYFDWLLGAKLRRELRKGPFVWVGWGVS
jgi:hypothetical protein